VCTLSLFRFQKEVAAADAAFGVLGVLSFFIRDNFLVATVIGASVMLFFMGIGHVLDIRKSRNISPYNAGSVVYFDILLPVAMIALIVLWKTGY
jgi:small-conductance mechanosensitive channel